MKPQVTVIVLTHNNCDDTTECLESVSRLDYPCFSVVLVDNHSTDGSIEKIKALFPNIHYVENARNLGVAGGRNAGWQYARNHAASDYLFFLDNDTIVMPDTLSHLAGCLTTHSDVATVCGKTYTAPPSTTIMSAGMTVNLYTGLIADIGTGATDVGQYETPGFVAACGGFGFLVRDSAFLECNGLDEDFSPYGWEDVDFNLRALEKGSRCYYVPEAIIYHKGCKIGRGYVPLYEKYKAKHYFRLLGRHTTFVQKICCSVCIPARALVAFLRLIVRGEVGVVVYQLSGAMESVFTSSRKAE